MAVHTFYSMLCGGRISAVEKPRAVADLVLGDPELLPELAALIDCEEPLVRSRAAYALKEIAASQPGLLQAFKPALIDRLAAPDDSHISRYCMLESLRCLVLSDEDVSLLLDMLKDFMHSDSSIVKALTLQMLAEFMNTDESLRAEIIPLLWEALNNGTPAMRARARKLLKQYKL